MSKIDDDLNIKLPIWNAGMGFNIAGPALAAAVSNARGLGVVGVGGATAEEIRETTVAVRRLTNRAFGANIILPLLQGGEIETCFDEKVPLMILFWGDPAPYVADAHRRGIKILVQCGNAEEAVQAADAGVDGVIIQGVEAGGHVKATQSLTTTLAETTRELGSLHVAAAGGIANGRDIADTILAGANSVSMGTRFLSTREAAVTDEYKQRVVDASAEQTVFTEVFDIGWPRAAHRVIRNDTYNHWESAGSKDSGQRDGEGDVVGTFKNSLGVSEVTRFTIIPPIPNINANIEDLPLYAGQSCERITEILNTSDLMAQLTAELHKAMT